MTVNKTFYYEHVLNRRVLQVGRSMYVHGNGRTGIIWNLGEKEILDLSEYDFLKVKLGGLYGTFIPPSDLIALECLDIRVTDFPDFSHCENFLILNMGSVYCNLKPSSTTLTAFSCENIIHPVDLSQCTNLLKVEVKEIYPEGSLKVPASLTTFKCKNTALQLPNRPTKTENIVDLSHCKDLSTIEVQSGPFKLSRKYHQHLGPFTYNSVTWVD